MKPIYRKSCLILWPLSLSSQLVNIYQLHQCLSAPPHLKWLVEEVKITKGKLNIEFTAKQCRLSLENKSMVSSHRRVSTKPSKWFLTPNKESFDTDVFEHWIIASLGEMTAMLIWFKNILLLFLSAFLNHVY